MYRFTRVLIAVACAVCAVYAQGGGKKAAVAPADAAPASAAPAKSAPALPDAPVMSKKSAPAPAAAAPAAQEKPLIKSVEIRSGARGMILFINGSGPIALGGKPTDYEKATVKYKEFRVNIPGVGSALGASATFNPSPELPIKDIILANAANGVSVTVKMRGIVNGPIDVRNSNNQVRILLTKAALPEIVWSSEKGVISAPPPGAAADAKKTAASAAGGAPPAKDGAAPQKQARGAPKVAPKSETPAARESNIAPSGEVTRKTPDGELVRYKVFGRDPFVPLLRDTSVTALPNVENLRLVGVLEDARERIALVEDFKNGNKAFALRANDAVAYGKVLRVHRDKVIFLIRDFDVSRSYTLGLSK